MKMEVQQKLAIRHSIIIAFGFVFLLQLINCKDSNTKADLGYGKSFFNQNCSSCHEKNGGFDNAPSLVLLNKYDSLTLLKKLSDIKQDSLHGNYFKSVKYSNREINSIEEYIKNHCCPTKIGFKNSTTLCHPWLQRKSPLIQNPGSTRCF
jgi:cytochrome c553